MDDLLLKRKNCRTRFTKYGNATKTYYDASEKAKEDKLKLATVKNAHKLWEGVFNELQAVQAEIDAHPDNEDRIGKMALDKIKKELDDELSYNDTYFKLTAKIQTLDEKPTLPKIFADSDTGGSTEGGVTNADALSQILHTITMRKREIEIPKFSGDVHLFDQWKTLIESEFKKPGYTEAEKAHYTLTLLTGNAQKIVSALKDPTYAEILETLEDKYGDVHTKLEQAVLEISNLPPIQGHGVKALDDLYGKLVSSWNYILKKTHDEESLRESSWILTALVRSKLPKAMIRRWDGERVKEDKRSNDDQVTNMPISFDELLAKIHESLVVARRSEPESNPGNKNSDDKKTDRTDRRRPDRNYPNRRATGESLNIMQSTCVFCKKTGHQPTSCFEMKKLKVYDRRKLLKESGACYKCFTHGHRSFECSKPSCAKCGEDHNQLVHYEPRNSKPAQNGRHPRPKSEDDTVTSQSGLVRPVVKFNGKQILMQTAMALCESRDVSLKIRVLFDNGSGVTFIKLSTARKLGLKGPKVNGEFTLAGGSKMNLTTERVKLRLSSCIPGWNGDVFEIVAYTLEKPSAPVRSVTVDLSKLPYLKDLKLCDHYPRNAEEVDILLGLEDTLRIMMGERICGGIGEPIAQKTHFGYVLGGPYDDGMSMDQSVSAGTHRVHFKPEQSDQEMVLAEKHWELEHLGIRPDEGKSGVSPDEQEAMNQHQQITQFVNGRYVTGLIKKPAWQNVKLKSNRNFAYQRLRSTERRLERDTELQRLYQDQLEDLVRRGHAVKVLEKSEPQDRSVWYLPHHPVVKPDKVTTKVRPVFDGSAKGPEGVSLNYTLLPGPKLQPDICGLLMRFRCFKIVIIADIEKMFHQIQLNEIDQDSQRFLWRNMKPDIEPEVYKLTTVTFGLTTSPFSSIKVIQQHADSMKSQYPKACEEILNSTYVDDVLSGADEVSEAATLALQLKEVLESGGFPLKKFASNKPEALCLLDEQDLATQHVKMVSDGESGLKALGTKFDTTDDKLMFSFCEKMEELLSETRRSVLKQLHRIYDPMGVLSPFLVVAKMLFQRSWTVVCGWDDPLPDDLQEEWRHWKADVKNLDDLILDRYVLLEEKSDVTYTLQGFGDASEKAYACCVYIRSESPSGEVKVSLLCSKTRVSPMKQKRTIPELELLAALITCRLLVYVKNQLKNITVESMTCWTDSKVTLEWISQPPYTWKTFVSNRVSEIQGLVKDIRHVPGKSNPADLCSRGCSATELIQSSLWWNGPEFLKMSEDDWPKSDRPSKTAKETAMKNAKPVKAVVNLVSEKNADFLESCIEKYESYNKFMRVMCLVRRWRRKMQDSHEGRTTDDDDPLVLTDRKKEELWWMSYIQKKHFPDDVRCLKAGHPVSKSSRLKSLDPVWDEKNEVIRVGGRLNKSLLPDEQKHPVILPSGDKLVEKLVLWYHRLDGHTGPTQTLATLRLKYWLLKGVKETMRLIQHCKCKEPKKLGQKMGQLPIERVIDVSPFTHVGCDYAGPLYVKNGKTKTNKSYILIFTCMTVRAVHLELLEDMTADEFLKSFERMMNRRGKPSIMWSDNAKSLKKSANILIRMFKEKGPRDVIISGLSKHGIEWKFITPRAPWQGAFYERLVRSVKEPLRKVIGRACLTFSELTTVLTGIECQLNSRPITSFSSEKNDLLPLTPAHFLTGRNLQAVPDVDSVTKGTSLGKRWMYRQRLEKSFWTRWYREYLAELNRFKKWTVIQENLKVGDIVLIAEDNVKKTEWKMGRVIAVYAGRDNLVRSVSVKTSTGVLKRPVQKLRLLESDDEK